MLGVKIMTDTLVKEVASQFAFRKRVEERRNQSVFTK